MMKKFIICIMLVMLQFDMLGQNLQCFTHPFCHKDEPIPLFSEPYVYMKDLYMLGEAGFEVEALRKEKNFILLSHLPNEIGQAWVKIGDVGVIIQNYDNDLIPLYIRSDSLSSIQTYLSESYIAVFYDWTKDFVMIRIDEDYGKYVGWINRRYVCGSPYTTCN